MVVILKQRIIAPDKVSGDKFGYTIAKRSNWMAISNHPVTGGIPDDPSDCAVYMYENVSGTWTYRQKIVIVDSAGDGQYPWYFSTKLCVALSQTNNWLSIGAINKVFLYHLESGTWTLKQTIDEPSGFWDHFGFSVAMTDYLLIIGQPITWASGFAFAYTFDGTTWSLQSTIVNHGDLVHYSDFYFYGWSVAIDESSISGDSVLGNVRVAVSNPCLVSGTPQGVNDIWIWKRNSGTWSNTTKIDELHSTGNGWAVTTDQDTLLALNIDYNGGTYSELRSFIRDSGFETYSFYQDLSTTILTHDVEGQYLLSTSGGYLVASNCLNTVSGNSGAGSINVFSSTLINPGLSWGDAYSLLPPNIGTNYNFGWATSLDSYSFAVSAINEVDDGTPSGAVYVFEISNIPVVDFTSDTTSGTKPLTANFTDLSTNSPTSWLWNFGDGNTSTDQNPTHIYSNSGLYTVSLKATNLYGEDTETKNNYIEVLGLVPVANFTSDVRSGAESLTVSFTDLSTNSPTSWLWDFGDGNTSTDQNPVHIFSTFGFRNVSLTATNDDGSNTFTATNYIFVGKANFSAAPLSGYANLTVQFTDLSIFMDPTTITIKTWLWDFGDGSISTEQNPSHTYTTPGKYTVTLVVTEEGLF